ncbi:MAG: ComEC/Rec2 family competence protein [Muribaculaceae bacterium]|nr:ComEC/Rec2 family competence protein [Muribaculaceae bacterium]
MKKLMQSAPALPLAAGAVTAAIAVSADSAVAYILSIISLICAFAVFIYGKGASRAGMLLTAAVTLIVAWESARHSPPAEMYDGVPRHYSVCVKRVSELNASVLVTADVKAVEGNSVTSFPCDIILSDVVLQLEEGMKLTVYGVFEPADKYAGVPFLNMRELGTRGSGSCGRMTVTPADVSIVGFEDSFQAMASRVRRSIAESIYSTPMDTKTSALLVSSCFGGHAGAGVKDRFRSLGIAHLLCVSGFHVGLLALFLGILCYPLGVWSKYGRVRYLIIVAGVWLYAILCGLSPSVQRASVMITAYYICVLMESDRPAWNGLLLSVAVIVMCNPASIISPGFQLSVGAVAGLITFSGAMNPVPGRIRGFHSLAGLIISPFAAMLGTAPVLLAWFHELPLLSVPANALAVLLFPVFMVSGIITSVLHAAGYGVSFLSGCMDFMYRGMEKMCDTAIDCGPAALRLYLQEGAICLFALAIVAFAFVIHGKGRTHRVIAVCVMLVFLSAAGCSAPRKEVSQFLVDGSRFSTETVLIDRGKILTFEHMPLRANSAVMEYVHGCGFDVAEVEKTSAREFEAGGIRVVFAGKELPKELVPGADFLIIDHGFRGSYASLLLLVKPKAVVSGCNIEAERAKALKDICERSGIPLHPLNCKALFLEF